MKLAIVNHTTPDPSYGPLVSDANLRQLAEALVGYAGIVGEEHSIAVTVRLSEDGTIAADEYELGLFDQTDQAGAGGYHDTDPRGQPYGKAFRNEAQDFGDTAWGLAAIASHELAEMIRDPYAQWWCNRGAYEEALELCDRCEGFSFDVCGLQCADFLRAAAFNPTATSGPWDWTKNLSAQTDVSPQGYVITRSVSWNNAIGAHLQPGARFGAQRQSIDARRSWWQRKTSKYGRAGKRLGMVQAYRCPVCSTPLNAPAHMKNPCSA